ncbi:Beta-galactosidase [Thalictrum thalictroides]|uniref:Beta-galactosidase n=1 Tax=Thalictrum thalictroides TaxID=46969 RepID=A0A7J6W7H3_THATH|nr:Beta-galactosidase [Thalictrum thalictroides]
MAHGGTNFEFLNGANTGADDSDYKADLTSYNYMFGLLLYVSEYSVKEKGSILSIPKVHYRAQVFISCTSENNGRNPAYVGTIERWSNLALEIPRIACASKFQHQIVYSGNLNFLTVTSSEFMVFSFELNACEFRDTVRCCTRRKNSIWMEDASNIRAELE